MSDTIKNDAAQNSPADRAVSNMLRTVGERVRTIRETHSISRRKLSDISGISPRYLAQIENGDGNISITLLKRIAMALDHSIESFLTDEVLWKPATVAVADLFEKADPATRDAVLELLSPEPQHLKRAERICLIGLRGAGKSTLGKKLAAATGIRFLELNHEIEKMGGMPIAEIMALYGPEGYRKFESVALNQIINREERIILEAAGGIVLESSTFSKLLARFNTVWVKASPKEHMDRVLAQGDTRPMAGNPEAMNQLKLLLDARNPLYAQAQLHLDTSETSEHKSIEQLVEAVRQSEFLEF